MEYAVSIVTTKKNTNARKMDVCACLITFGEMALRASLSPQSSLKIKPLQIKYPKKYPKTAFSGLFLPSFRFPGDISAYPNKYGCEN